MFNLQGQYERYAEIYEATTSDHGLHRLKSLISDVPERDSIGVASQELPVPAHLIWTNLVTNLESIRGSALYQDPNKRFLSTAYFVSARAVANVAYDRLFVTLEPTEHGTTVIHLGLLRNVEIWERRDPETGEWRISPVAGDSPEYRQVERTLDEDHATRLAVVMLKRIAIELVSKEGVARLPERVNRLREAHLLSTTAPSGLELVARFDDSDSILPNNLIDPGEAGRFRLTVSNSGAGTAYAVAMRADGSSDQLDLPEEVMVGDLEPGATRELSIPFGAGPALGPASLTVYFQAIEKRGYDSDLLELVLPVAPLVPPDLRIVTAGLDLGTGDDGDGYLGSGEAIELAVVVENRGRGPAAGVALHPTSAAPGLSIEGERLELGRIDAGGSVQARIPVSLAPTAGDEPVEILLVVVDGRGEEVGKAERRVSLPVVRRRPLIEIAHRLYDGDSAQSSGDRDGVVQNGEAPELELRIANRGRLSAEAVEVELQAFPAEMTVAPGRLVIGTLPALTEGEARTVRLALPRSLDHVGPLRLTLVVRQRHFAPQRRTIELPFTRRTPDLRVGPRLLAGLLPGRIEARTLLIQNVGNLEARGVRTTVRAADPDLELLDHAGAPAPELSVERAELRTADAALEIPVRLIAKGQATGVGSLTVEVRQDDFPPVVATVEVPIEARVTQRVEIAPLPEWPEPPTEGAAEDRTPPVVLIIEPGDVASQESASFTVRSAQVRVRGTASDASGIYRVAVGESPVTVDAHGTFTAWVKLRFGRNDLRVTAEDVHGNVGAVRFTIERLGDAGRPRIDRALLFATDRYDHWSALSNPVADARELAATLEASYGFTVEVVANPTRVDVLRTLRRYAEMEPGAEDQLLVFFAGHGHFDERFDEGYLVTSESLRRDELGTSYLAFSQLANLLDGLPHRHLLVVLDACFGGAFDQKLSRARGPAEEAARRTEAWIAEKLRPLGRLYLAAGAIERVDDGPAGGNSPFMRRLLGALHQASRSDRPLTSRELFVLMDRPTPLDPEPRAGGFGDHEPDGDFLFIPASR